MMDRALKERIIGAVALVLVAVLVVPVFLDGPPGRDEIVRKNVPLPGQSQQDRKTVVLDRDRTDPVPSNGSRTSAESAPEALQGAVEEKTEPQVGTKPVPAAAHSPPPQPKAEETAAPTSQTGMFVVQLGSFGNQQNAEKLAADLRKQDFAAFLSQKLSNGVQMHRVRIGPQKDRESAEAMLARLKKDGHEGQVVPHP
jgi:DedD protein